MRSEVRAEQGAPSHCLYTIRNKNILQAQHESRIKVATNGFTALGTLSLCEVTYSSTFPKFLIAHCSMCGHAHVVNGTLSETLSLHEKKKKKKIRNKCIQQAKASHAKNVHFSISKLNK